MSEKENVKKEIKRVIEECSLHGLTEIPEDKSKDIISDIFYSFVDISKYTKISLNKIYNKLDDRLNNQYKRQVSFGELSWEDFLSYIYKFVPKEDNQVYLVVSGASDEDYSVIYDGELVEVYKLLFDGVPLGNNGDFSIVSKYYDWLIYYDDTSETLGYISEKLD
ncbi:MAG: DUF6756 family protein [Oscillospiraceae bacterium]